MSNNTQDLKIGDLIQYRRAGLGKVLDDMMDSDIGILLKKDNDTFGCENKVFFLSKKKIYSCCRSEMEKIC